MGLRRLTVPISFVNDGDLHWYSWSWWTFDRIMEGCSCLFSITQIIEVQSCREASI